jgi:thymidylate kinase
MPPARIAWGFTQPMNETGTEQPAADAPAPLGSTVALIGSDGAGKSTVAREVVRRLPIPSGYLYMGVNLEASPVMLPTTRLALAIKRRRGGRSDMTVGHNEPGGGGGPLGSIRRLVRMVNWLAEETYRAALARRIQRTPAVVVFDRHFFCDYYANAIAPTTSPRSLDTRIHGWVLKHWYPRPQLTLFMDAPPEVLVARKAGDSIERVAKRREEYLALADVLPAFQVVDANRPVEVVAEDVVARIVAFETARINGLVAPGAETMSAPADAAETDGPRALERAAIAPMGAAGAPAADDVEGHDVPATDLLGDLRAVLPLDPSVEPSGA